MSTDENAPIADGLSAAPAAETVPQPVMPSLSPHVPPLIPAPRVADVPQITGADPGSIPPAHAPHPSSYAPTSHAPTSHVPGPQAAPAAPVFQAPPAPTYVPAPTPAYFPGAPQYAAPQAPIAQGGQLAGQPPHGGAPAGPYSSPVQATGATQPWNSAPPGVPGQVGSPRRSRRSTALVVVLAVLVVAVGAQSFALIHVSGKVSSANRHATASDARIKALQSGTSKVQAKIEAGMDPVAVAAAGLPSVFQVDAGDFLGTGWGVAHPTGGGTDLITNFHVISSVYNEGKRSVEIDHKSERFTASVKRVNKAQDLALLHVTETFPILAVAKTAEPGEPIVVLGEPLGLEDTVTVGVVSALHRTVPGTEDRTFIQFDAAINPGNSGGPVVNAQEQVVGIASEKFTDAEGLALAIPIATACTVLTTC